MQKIIPFFILFYLIITEESHNHLQALELVSNITDSHIHSNEQTDKFYESLIFLFQ